MVTRNLRQENIKQLKTKNGKLNRFNTNYKPKSDKFTVPIINLSSFEVDVEAWRYGLDHCFVDKYRYIKRDLAVELENLADTVDGKIPSEKK